MIVTMSLGKREYRFYLDQPIEIAMPLDFEGAQPHVHGIGKAMAKTQEADGMVGDVCRGGGCNWRQYTLTPHSHGTHTECIGHITEDAIAVHKVLKSLVIPATLITITPVKGAECGDTYFPKKNGNDWLITREALERALRNTPEHFCEGVVIRTLPNDESKLSRDYQKFPPPYFSHEAMQYLVERGVQHLLVDFPSIDRMHDEGQLSNHRLFWNVPLGSIAGPDAHIEKTITEMVYVPPSVIDNLYALNLQVPSLVADAVPSRPLLFQLKPLT